MHAARCHCYFVKIRLSVSVLHFFLLPPAILSISGMPMCVGTHTCKHTHFPLCLSFLYAAVSSSCFVHTCVCMRVVYLLKYWDCLHALKLLIKLCQANRTEVRGHVNKEMR